MSLFFIANGLFAQYDATAIDSINAIEVQGAQISQDSLKTLLLLSAKSAKKLGYRKGEADAHVALGVHYYYAGDFEANATSTLKAIKIYEDLGDDGSAARAYGELGYQSRRHDLTMANSFMQKGIKLAEINKIYRVLPSLYNNYGVLKDMEGKKDSALHYSLEGLSLVRKLNDSIGIGYSLANIGNVYVTLNDLATAKTYFDESLLVRQKLKDSIALGESYVQQGELYELSGNLELALDSYRTSNEYSEKKKYLRLTSYSYYMMSQVFKKRNNADSALHYFEKHLLLKDSITNQGVLEKLAALRVEFDTGKKENEILLQRTQLAEKDLEVKRRNSFIYGGSALVFVLGLIGYLLYSRQKSKNKQLKKEAELKSALAKIETQNRLQEQRLRISRDLHDNIGSQLTFVTSSVDNLKYGLKDSNSKVTDKLSKISDFTTQTIYELRDTIWAMNKTEISVEDLQARIANFIDKAGSVRDEIEFNFTVSQEMSEGKLFSSIAGMNIYRIIQEAVNNALKYSNATKIEVFFGKEKDQYILKITDNGIGFDIPNVELGNGLNNMKKRARDIDAAFEIISREGKGTTVNVAL